MADGVALAVAHAHEPRGNRLVVLDQQNPRAAHAPTVPRPAGPPANFDPALTSLGERADLAVEWSPAMTSMRSALPAAGAALMLVAAGCGGGSSASGTETANFP